MLLKSITDNYIFYCTAFACAVVLAKCSGTSPFFAVLTLVYVSLVGYIGHAFVHHVNYTAAFEPFKSHPLFESFPWARTLCERFCYYTDFHEVTHHDTAINRTIPNLMTEFVLNFLNQGGILFGAVLACRYMNLAVILLWALAYCTVHNINYDYLRPKAHQYHHKDAHTNYGIDAWDIFFGTKHPEDKEVENINHYSINMVVLTALLGLYLVEK